MKNVNIKGLIIIAFLISWIGITPSILISYGFNIPNYLKPLELLMTFGTLIAALIYTYKANGKKGMKDLLSKFLKFKAPVIVIFVAFLFPILASFLGSYLGFSLANLSWPERYTSAFIMQEALRIFIMYLILNTEEIAWRGVVFDKLLSKYGFIKSCLILLPIWWLFHIPYFLHAGGHPAGYGIGIFTLMVFAQTFILGWIYKSSNGSLFYSHISHQLTNAFAEAFPLFPVFIGGTLIPLFIFCIILILMASLVVLYYLKKQNTNQFYR